MKHKKGTFAGWFVLVCLLLILAGYLAISIYYCRVFSYGTWINGVYCTGKSTEEVNAQLIAETVLPDIQITDINGLVSVISLKDTGYEIDYLSQLEECRNSQSPFFWFHNLYEQIEYTLEPVISLDEDRLAESLGRTQALIRSGLRPQTVEIFLGAEGYELYNGMEQVLNVPKVQEAVQASLSRNVFEIDLAVSGCYEQLPLTEAMLETVALYEKVREFQSCGIVYDMGDSEVSITPAVTAGWIALDEDEKFLLDENGGLILAEEGIESFINALCDEYDTYGGNRTFHATRGEEVVIEGGIYGNQIDREAEIRYLKEAFENKASERRIPEYSRQAWVRGKDDIGDTYIEIDMTQQKMYYYVDGEQIIATDIVTGNMRRSWDTPSGVNYVYNKQKNRVLRGEGYASPVKFWMPVTGNIGIHDASWRSGFGGDIYLKNGSHGCINTPTEVMTELYGMVEKGTPVVMFY